MSKSCLSFCLLLSAATAFSQRERAHLTLDKYFCQAGNTVCFNGTVLKGDRLGSSSTILYVFLCTKKGVVVQRTTFPISKGRCPGQIRIPPDLTSANYYLVPFTKEMILVEKGDIRGIPLAVVNPDDKVDVQFQRCTQPESSTAAMLKGITWQTSFVDGKIKSLLAIPQGSPARHLQLMIPHTKDSVEMTSVSLAPPKPAKYSFFSVHPERDSEALFLFEDSVLLGKQIIMLKQDRQPVDIGLTAFYNSAFGLNSLYIDLPGLEKWQASISVTNADRSLPSPAPITMLQLSHTDIFPRVDPPGDNSYIRLACRILAAEGKAAGSKGMHHITIAGYQQSRCLFTKTVPVDAAGIFVLDSLYFFGKINLRILNGSKMVSTLGETMEIRTFRPYISNIGAIINEMEDIPRNPAEEREINAKKQKAANNRSYPFVSHAAVHRTMDTVLTIRSGIDGFSVTGFSELHSFVPDDITLYWEPAATGNRFNVKFYDVNKAKSFRIIIDAVNTTGKTMHYEHYIY